MKQIYGVITLECGVQFWSVKLRKDIVELKKKKMVAQMMAVCVAQKPHGEKLHWLGVF